MAGWEFGLAIGITIAVIVVVAIIILCVYGGRKISDSVQEHTEKKLAAKRDAEERDILGGDLTAEKEKIGIIISPLEGFLLESDSFWKNLNSEIGFSAEYDQLLQENLSLQTNYFALVKKIILKWKQSFKDSLSKLNKQFFSDFYQKYLRIREGAKEFIEYCQKDYDYYVVSEASWEFCLLAKAHLGFYHYYATTIFTFDRNNQLNTTIAHKHGSQTEKIMAQIIKKSKFSIKETVVISNLERDLNMLNQAGFAILIDRNISTFSTESALNPNVISLPDLNFEDLKVKIDRITESIKQANNSSVEKEK
jgi:phosphoserine phosphatase